MPLDHTADLGQLKQELVLETNKKAELWQLLIKAGDELSKSKQTALQCNNLYMQIKTQIKVADERIKTLKTMINSEKATGG